MPQDSLRSAVYRSFVTCEDPKGVVECGTIRRSRSGSEKMEHKNGGRKAQNKSNPYVASKAEREEIVSKAAMEELHSSSSCQLMEVSRGAHRLNQVIDSWSKGLWCDGHSKDIAKDLLKGALDLQDSLHMLGKLQEASHYMARLKKKEKEKCERVRTDQVVRRMNSSPVGERNYPVGIENPRLSVDGSSRDCIEELREVIRDSLARQNLFPNVNAEEKRCFSRRYPDSASDIPSTSSSSTVQTENFTSMDSPISSAALEQKASSPTLIAKLMGLEEMPSKPLQTNSPKELESKKIFSQQRPIFEIDTPKARKSQFVFRKEDPQRRALKDILESMQFKGLQKSNSIKEIKPDSHQWRDFCSEKRLINDGPPIVLIRPRYYPHLPPKEKFVPLFQEEGSFNSETMLKKVKVKEEPPSKTIDSSNRGLNFYEMSRRVEAEETPIKRLSQQDGAKDSQEKEARPVKKEAKIKQKLSPKMKSSGPVTQPLLKKEATEKKIDRMPKPAMSSRKPVEKGVAKAKNLSGSKDQAKVIPPKSRNGTNVTKNKISPQRSATAKCNSNPKPQAVVRGRSDRKKSPTKKEKAVSKATAAKITTEELECKGDDIVLVEKRIDLPRETDTVLEGKRIDLTSENDTVLEGKMIDLASENDIFLKGYSTETVDQLAKKEGTEHTDIQIGEYYDKSESSVCDVTLGTTDDQNNRRSIGEVDDDPIIPIGTNSESFLRGASLKALLLSSPAFLNHAEEHFHLHVNVPTTSQKFGISDFTDANTPLYLDCADEIVQRRSFPDSQMVHPPLLTLVGNAETHISLDHLLKETCDGVEALRSYSELASEKNPTDSLYAMLERDLKLSEVVSAIWDLGWRNGFSVDDKLQVADDLEKQLLSGLIEEVCA